ncbi:myotubularin family protein, partial [Acanthamoeba castellanii str. Neff]
LVALAQLLLDPHYRTIHGYEILIEKEFLSFGHRFQDRCGHHGKKEKDQRSPIFHQFLECTWQLLQQFPSAFEFNELFLETVLEHVYSCRFGTFFMNSAKERADSQLAERTCSLWTTINGFGSDGEDVGVFSPEDVETPAGAAADAASLLHRETRSAVDAQSQPEPEQ